MLYCPVGLLFKDDNNHVRTAEWGKTVFIDLKGL